jgi:hypothetical protein
VIAIAVTPTTLPTPASLIGVPGVPVAVAMGVTVVLLTAALTT